MTAWCQYADYGAVHHAIAVAGAGDVIVVAAGGRTDAAMIGELLSGAARLKKVVGVVVDGAVRDVGTLVSWPDFPVFSRGRTARGPSSMERGSVNETVVFGGVPVSPGDLVVGDDDGLVVVPYAEAALRLPAARRWSAPRTTGRRGWRGARPHSRCSTCRPPSRCPEPVNRGVQKLCRGQSFGESVCRAHANCQPTSGAYDQGVREPRQP